MGYRPVRREESRGDFKVERGNELAESLLFQETVTRWPETSPSDLPKRMFINHSADH
jgi:hypothetical protein